MQSFNTIVGIDTGGTFTDFIAWNGRTFSRHKVLSTPKDPTRAILQGLEEMGLADNSYVVHGSTIATNAILERKGAQVALIITDQFRDVLEIGRQNRGKLYDLNWEKPKPLFTFKIPVKERLDHKGQVLVPIDTKSITNGKIDQADSIAICFLHSYRNDIHEQLVKRKLKNRKHISCSSEICPEYREFERFSTTVMNAYVAPLMENYLSKLAKLVKSANLVSSAGGILSLKSACERPVETILSGPCAGALATRELVEQMGIDQAISFDMGGTSTDVSVVQRELRFTKERHFAGFPVRVPMIDIQSIGAGGGSICWIDEGGALRAGPHSAGSDPGPACYSLGGTDPTITDANLVLGRLDPANFFDGKIILDKTKAAKAIESVIPQVKAKELAKSFISIVNSNMARAIHTISSSKGLDPREFPLVAFGGAGPLHACELASMIGIKKILVPRDPGLFSALGAIMAPVIKQRSKTILLALSKESLRQASHVIDNLLNECTRDLSGKPEIKPFFEMRYKGQSYELLVPFNNNLDQLTKAFHNEHVKTFGYSRPSEIEIVNCFVIAQIKPKPIKFTKLGQVTEDFRIGKNTYMRYSLPYDSFFKGPAILIEKSSTISVPRGYSFVRDKFENLIIIEK